MADPGTVMSDSTTPVMGDPEIVELLRRIASPPPAPYGSAQKYEAHTISIAANSAPTPVLGLDTGRVRAYLIANVDDCYFGHRDVLSSNNSGYPIPRSGGFEIQSVQEICVMFTPSAGNTATQAVIGVYLETNS